MRLVGGPLNRIQINTFFGHFPERRHITQLTHARFEQFNSKVDLFFGGKAADGKANRTMCEFVVAPQGAQYIRGLKTGRGASRTA